MSVPSRAADRNLLFGILALQMYFVSRDQLIAAMHAWVLDKARPLGQLLVEQEALGQNEHALLEALVEKHVERHGNDPEKSLAALSSAHLARKDLAEVADPGGECSVQRTSVIGNSARHCGCAASPPRTTGTAGTGRPPPRPSPDRPPAGRSHSPAGTVRGPAAAASS